MQQHGTSVSLPGRTIRRSSQRPPEAPPPSVAVVAQRQCPVSPGVINKVLSILSQLKRGSIINVRASDPGTRTSPIEELVWQLADDMGFMLEDWAAMKKTAEGLLYRNRKMIEASPDGLYAFFAEKDLMGGGTGLLVRAAYERGYPIEAYTVGETGDVTLFGSLDGFRSDPDLIAAIDAAMP